MMNKMDTSDLNSLRYSVASETVGTTWPFEDFVRICGEYESVVVADSKRGILEYGIFQDANNKQIVACVSDIVKKYSGEEFEKNRSNFEVVVLESGMYCVCKKWEEINLEENLKQIDGSKEKQSSSRGNWLNLNDMKRDAVEPYSTIKSSTNNEGRTTSSKKYTLRRQNKENKPNSSHYLAAFIDMLVALIIGVSVYNSNMIHLDQNRELFLGTCLFLAIVAWGYPYFETSVKIDNDGCFEQGCIHPIIGVFGVLFFPLFIHYWLYKGIKVCFIRLNGVVKRKQDVIKKDKEIKKRTHEREEYRRLQKIEDEKIEQERQKWLEENHRRAVERNERLNKLREHFKEVDAENEEDERSTDNSKL